MNKKDKVEIIVDPEDSGLNFWGTRVLFPFVKAYTSDGARIDPSDWIAEPVGQPDAIYMSEEDFCQYMIFEFSGVSFAKKSMASYQYWFIEGPMLFEWL